MSDETRRQLGRVILQKKLVSQDADGLVSSRKPASAEASSQPVEDDIEALRVLSEHHGVPGIDLRQVAILLEHLSIVPREVAESHLLLPVLVKGDRIFLAMANPADKRVIDELEFVMAKRVFPYVARPAVLRQTIAAAFDARSRGESHYLGPMVPPETLKQLGLTPAAHSSKAPPRPREPERTAVIVTDGMRALGEASEVSADDFGTLSNEVSTVSEPPQQTEDPATPGEGSGKLVLVADDDPVARDVVRLLLVNEGHRVLEADTGGQALRLLKEHHPDLLILEARLPEIHGFEIARRLKESQKYGHVPMVMASGVYRGWRIAEDLKAAFGVSSYLEKPYQLAELTLAVRAALAGEAPPSGRAGELLSEEAASALEAGIAAYKASDLDGAIAHLQRGIEIDPLAFRLRYHLALLYGKRGHVFEGIGELERAVELNTKHFPALKNLAVLYEKAGFKNKALEMWERAVAGAPDEATRDSVKQHIMALL